MFTIKWIASNGSQMLYQGRAVSFTPGDVRAESARSGDEAKACVSFEMRDDIGETYSHCSIDNGRIFVMNEAGATVADYILETKEYPHGVMPRAA